jgi:activating signal cointegrator complex subunit 1
MPKKSRNITRGPKSGGQSSNNAITPSAERATKSPLTHFLCIPLITEASRPQLEDSLLEFKSKMHQFVPLLPAKAVRPLGTLHLTLGVMSLAGEERLGEAIALLKSLDLGNMVAGALEAAEELPVQAPDMSPLVESTGVSPDIPTTPSKSSTPPPGRHADSTVATEDPIIISLTSLHSMHSPQKTSVLYASPLDPTSRLYPFCNNLRQLFTAEGYIVPDDRPLKLHATIVNTVYAKPGARNQALLRIDATALMAEFEEFVWTKDVRVEEIAICKMGARKLLGEGGAVVGEEYEKVVSVGIS